MKAKFLIPEIDKKRFAENLSEEMRRSKLELKSLTEIGVEEVSTASIWQYREGIKFPTINRFLTLCRFFTTAPDVFLSPIPKWVECEIDDVSKFSVLGKFNDVYYIAPNYQSFLKNQNQNLFVIYIYTEQNTMTQKNTTKEKLFIDFQK